MSGWWWAALALAGTDFDEFASALQRAVRQGDQAHVHAVWTPMLARHPEADGQLMPLLRQAMRGRRSTDCRGQRCQLRFTRGDGQLTLWFAPKGESWHIHDPTWAMEDFAHQVSASLTVEGTVDVGINGQPNFLLERVSDTTAMVSMLNDALVVGDNTLTLTPVAGEARVALRLHAWPKETAVIDTSAAGLVDLEQTLTEPTTVSFTVQ